METQVGDLLFTYNKGLIPWLIRLWTRRGAPAGQKGFNHVALCVGLDQWLSAEPKGVMIRNTENLIGPAEGYAILTFTGDPKVGMRAAQIASSAVRTGYDFVGIVGFVLSKLVGLRIDFRGRWFCSEICHFAWQEALVEFGLLKTFRDSADTTPNDLLVWAMDQGCFVKRDLNRAVD